MKGTLALLLPQNGLRLVSAFYENIYDILNTREKICEWSFHNPFSANNFWKRLPVGLHFLGTS